MGALPKRIPGSAGSRRVYSRTCEHEGDRYELTVGEPRKVYKRKTGPRGGYIKDAGHEGWPTETGTVVSSIVDADVVVYVWSYGPPFGGWANPSFVGRGEVRRVEYFEDLGNPTEASPASGR